MVSVVCVPARRNADDSAKAAYDGEEMTKVTLAYGCMWGKKSSAGFAVDPA